MGNTPSSARESLLARFGTDSCTRRKPHSLYSFSTPSLEKMTIFVRCLSFLFFSSWILDFYFGFMFEFFLVSLIHTHTHTILFHVCPGIYNTCSLSELIVRLFQWVAFSLFLHFHFSALCKFGFSFLVRLLICCVRVPLKKIFFFCKASLVVMNGFNFCLSVKLSVLRFSVIIWAVYPPLKILLFQDFISCSLPVSCLKNPPSV